MKKIFILIFIYFIFVTPAFANYVLTDDLDFNEMKFSETENPVTYKYFVDYADMISRKLNFVKLNPSWGVHFYGMINVDGTLSNLMDSMLPTSERTNRLYFARFLIDNPAPPYPENMEIGYVNIHIYIQNATKNETFIYFKNNKSKKSIYEGNHVFIAIYRKSWVTKIIDKFFY